VYDNSSSSSLLSGDASDFQRLDCTCTTRICKRFDRRSYIHTAAVLSFIFLYCTISLLIYFRRGSRTYVEMVQDLLQGPPPDTHPADIYTNALETISTFDQANAIWAIAGLVCAISALILRATQWEFDWKDQGNRSEEKTAAEEPAMLSYAEYASSFLLYVFLTRQTWYRVIESWRTVEIVETLPFYWGIVFLGMFAARITHSWVIAKERGRRRLWGSWCCACGLFL